MRPSLLAALHRHRLALAALALLALLAGLIGAVSSDRPTLAPSFGDAAPYDGRSPREPAGTEQRVVVALPRPALGARRDIAGLSRAAQRSYVRSLLRESRALRGALGARGVRLRDVVSFARVYDGFAATVATRDLPAMTTLGVRPEPVRRFYPALGEPVPVGAAPAGLPAAPRRQAPVALLAGGVDGGRLALRGRLAPGYDAVDRGRSPTPGADPRARGRREADGTALAALLAGSGERIMPIRVAGFRLSQDAGAEEVATTDTLIDGLEHAVDPDGNGDAADHVPVAAVAVNAPYSGFADTPEADAVHAAAGLGTLVLAPAGEEGRGTGTAGTLGSPAAAPDAVSVGATADARALARASLVVGPVRAPGALLLGGAELTAPLASAGVVHIDDPVRFAHGARVDLAGKVAIVPVRANPAGQVAAAAGAGAAAVVLALPGDRPLTAIPVGRVAVPVLGVTGAAAEAVLATRRGALVRLGAAVAGSPSAQPGAQVAPASSRGPTIEGAPAPLLYAAGAVRTLGGTTGGSAIAVARAAVAAARLWRTGHTAVADLRAALLERAGSPGVAVALPQQDLPPAEPPQPVPLAPLVLTRSGTQVTGVRFSLGAFARGDPFGSGTLVRAASRLELALVDARAGASAGQVVRALTPPGGARALLPAEYEYTLAPATLRALRAGSYAFRAQVHTPRRGGPPAEQRSPTFTRP